MDLEVSTKLDQLLKSATYSVECPAAFFYEAVGNDLQIAAQCNSLADPPPDLDSGTLGLLLKKSPEPVLMISGLTATASLTGTNVETTFSEHPYKFFAIARVKRRDGSPYGILLVVDRQVRTALSAAQVYVLETHAVQLATVLDAQALKLSLSHREATTVGTSVSERLRLLESVVVHAKDAILITEAEPIDLPGPRIVYCNPAFTVTTGYAEADVIGKTPRILQNHNSDRRTLDRLRHALLKWQPVEVEMINAKKDGTEFWVELSIVPVCDETGWYTHWVSVQRDVTERKRAEELAAKARLAEAERLHLEAMLEEQSRAQAKLLFAATHDDLTKLRNRAFFIDRLNIALKQAQSHRQPVCAVLFLDLDRFKLINDSLGHHAGDLLLIMVARRLENCLRPQDTLARLGGDEFVVLIESATDMDKIIALADRICSVLKAPFPIERQELFTMCSIGIVEVTDRYHSAEEVLRDADIAMYAAKARRSGSYAVFTASMHAEAASALQLQTDLQYAIVRNEFILAYQLIHDAETRKICGMEALLRWQHPSRGTVGPSDFVSLAEEIGAIDEIGRWVLREACQQFGVWQASHPLAGLRLSVNVSGVQLLSPSLQHDISTLLEMSHINPRQLQLEITENVFLHDPERIGVVLDGLRCLGVRIALDDFGTGYSSLGYIDKYPIDTIKIDQSFVSRMQSQPRTMAIVDSIVLLGHRLGFDIVAEGVETHDQLEILRRAKCRYIQGYLLAKPLSGAEVSAMLQSSLS